MRPDADLPLRPSDVLWLQVALGFYGPAALGAAAWIAWFHGWPELMLRLVGTSVSLGVGLGVGLGLSLVVATRLAAHLELIDGLAVGLQEHIGPLRVHTCIVLAAASALGEEMLFRAVLQPAVGWLAATLVFALVHLPFDKRLAVWPLFAFAAGGLFGAAYGVTGGVLAPVLAHFVVNALNLIWLARRAER
jgi:membrane protease YdiL (CAAX protease family)